MTKWFSPQSQTLVELDLEENRIRHAGAKELSEALEINRVSKSILSDYGLCLFPDRPSKNPMSNEIRFDHRDGNVFCDALSCMPFEWGACSPVTLRCQREWGTDHRSKTLNDRVSEQYGSNKIVDRNDENLALSTFFTLQFYSSKGN